MVNALTLAPWVPRQQLGLILLQAAMVGAAIVWYRCDLHFVPNTNAVNNAYENNA